jgi:hypothetical protein
MALLGSSIDPSLFSNDYSGFANAGAIQGQSYAQLGKDVGGAIQAGAGAYMKSKDLQKSQLGDVKTAQSRISGMIKAFPSEADKYKSLGERLSNQNIPLEQRWQDSQALDSEMNDQFKFATLGMQQQAAGRAAQAAARTDAGRPKTDYWGNPIQ